jgi:3-oxoacyl-[acyl-carrier protein] reductase
MAKFSLDGTVAVVTGGESEPGATVAAELARRGAVLAVQYHTGFAAAKRLVRDIEREGGQAIAVKADLADPAQAEALCLRAGGALGRIDVMVINTTACTPRLDSLEGAAGALRACLAPAYAALPGMAERRAGSLVFLAGGGSGPAFGRAIAGAAMPYLAAAFHSSGVRVNTVVAGGPGAPPPGGPAGPDGGTALPRPASARDVAALVAMLAADDLAHVNGLTLTAGEGAHAI